MRYKVGIRVFFFSLLKWTAAAASEKKTEELTVANLSTTITFIIPLSHPVYLHGFYLVISLDWIDIRRRWIFFSIRNRVKNTDNTPAIYVSRWQRQRDLVESHTKMRRRKNCRSKVCSCLYRCRHTWKDWYEPGECIT